MIKSSKFFIGKSPECDISDYDGNTIVVGGDDNAYLFISGFQINKFSTEHKTTDFISFLSKNMTPISTAVGKNTLTSYLTITNSLKTLNTRIERC